VRAAYGQQKQGSNETGARNNHPFLAKVQLNNGNNFSGSFIEIACFVF
jgi:hypothetical protein